MITSLIRPARAVTTGTTPGPGTSAPLEGKDRISLAKRAGQGRGWQTIEVVTTAGRNVTKMVKTFLATWKPAGGVVWVVIVRVDDGSWRARLCTDPEASVEAGNERVKRPHPGAR